MAFDRTIRSLMDVEDSTANDRVRPKSPAFDAAYGTAPVPALRASSEDTLIMHFEGGFCPASVFLRSRIRLLRAARRNAREVSIAPSRLVRRTWEMSSNSSFGRIFETDIPAALTRTSTPACRRCQNWASHHLLPNTLTRTYHFLLQLTHPCSSFSYISDK